MAAIRAVVAKAQSSDHEVGDRSRASQFRAGFIRALLVARERTPIREHKNFFQNLAKFSSVQSARFSALPIAYDYLSVLRFQKELPIEHEISWISERLAIQSSTISAHLSCSKKISTQLMQGNYPDVISLLTAHEDAFGVSLWSTQLKIGGMQYGYGQNAQKKFVEELRTENKAGVLPFLAHYASQRSEEDVSIGWFVDHFTRRSAKLGRQDLAVYLRFKLLAEKGRSRRDIAAVLRIEQNHHLVDIYETFVGILGHLSTNFYSDKRLMAGIASALAAMSEIDDGRLKKIRLRFVSRPRTFDGTLAGSLDALFSGKISHALREQRRLLSVSPASIASLVTIATARASSRFSRKVDFPGGSAVHKKIVAALVSLFRKDAQLGNDRENYQNWLRKFAHIFSGLPIAEALLETIGAERATTVEGLLNHWSGIAQNCEEESIFDWLVDGAPEAIESLQELASRGGAAATFCLLCLGRRHHGEDLLDGSVYAYARSIGAVRRDAMREAEHHIGIALQSSNRVIEARSAILALEIYGETKNLASACRIISREHAVHGVDPSTLPLKEVFLAVDWEDLQPHVYDFRVSNALAVLAQVVADDKIHSYRCFALESFLESQSLSFPSELRENLPDYDKREIAFFLGQVCVVSVLDMLPLVNSSRRVLEERRDICALLVMSGMDSSGEYTDELVNISRELTVRKGLQALDGSRVHVDTDALRTVLKRDLLESFHRFISLKRTGPGAETYDAVIRDLNENAKYLLEVPESEADELLVSMILQARERFLFDVPHGLDSYLSKRVRHGSVVGYIRSPAEKEGVITQRAPDGTYRENVRWAGHFDDLALAAAFQSALAAFARDFDEVLVRLKDVLLHVKSESKPYGIFDARLLAPNYHLIKSVAIQDRSIDTFLATLMASLWGLLNPSLQAAQSLLRVETSKEVASLFQALRTRISVMPASEIRAELDRAVVNAAGNVQAAIESVASWFNPAMPEDSEFSADEIIDIALASARAINSADALPEPLRRCDASLVVSAGSLPVLLDVMFVILDNVAKRSGDPALSYSIDISYDRLEETLTIRVENSVVLGGDFASARAAMLERKRQLIEQADFRMARREGGSGLSKLASIVFQSAKGKMDFGFLSENLFFLELTLSFIANRGRK
ncbi:hypothetical protein [Tahibacter harae]|uniref:Uncharacterized protein n=1 Tax=Tahibacter harae TaxID=2963937 RepID=A0ABT1QV47_9GAMM|nr:hypothetical protein [Tahibacter harae]MCQ4166165.1 hypothetical protein [Tahibacter harae]